MRWCREVGESTFRRRPEHAFAAQETLVDSISSSDAEFKLRANQAYWQSNASVNELAERFDLSKSALYSLIAPLPAPGSCPTCKGRVEYPNRTARDKDLVQCPACGFEGSAAEAAATPDADLLEDRSAALDPAPRGLPQPSTWLGNPPERHLWLGGMLLGMAGVIVLARWTRR